MDKKSWKEKFQDKLKERKNSFSTSSGIDVDRFFTIDDMQKINFDKSNTLKSYDKNSYLFNVLTSLREKINSPTRKKKNN